MKLTVAEAEERVINALEANGVTAVNAEPVAVALVAAEAAGQGGHGLRRVVAYASQARAGKVDGKARPKASLARPGVLRIDAANGFAYPALDLAVAELPALAKNQGIAFAGIGRSHHAGVMGLTVERFAELGMVALMFANAPASIAPWGGSKPLYGTNPIAFALPVPGEEPIVIDLAISKVARGKIMAAAQKNAPIPDDWAFDAQGNPTSDAQAALAGTMAPLGGAKGAALALMIEILSAGLTDANYSYQSSSLFDDKGPPVSLGHSIILIDPLATGDHVTARFKEIAAEIEGQEGARLPGRRGQSLRRIALEDGIEVEDEVLAQIAAIS